MIELDAQLPFHTLLAFEDGVGEAANSSIRGARGQALVVPTTFTYGVPAGAEFEVRGHLPWRQLPADHDGGVLQLHGASAGLQVAWQFAPPDAVRRDRPDLAVGRVGRWSPATDRTLIGVPASSFVRFELRATVGRHLPQLERLRLVAR